ncbi:MAG: diguanylate cyclase [bacterium]|nr:diguanylate cyclase [bacterium]
MKEIKENTCTSPIDGLNSVEVLLGATSDLAAIIGIDGKVLAISEAAAGRIGQSRAQMIGTCIFDLFPTEMLDIRKAYFNMAAQSAQPIRYEDNYNGMSLLVCHYPIEGRNKVIDKVAVFISDNTTLKEQEITRHNYAQIISTINDPIIFIDKNFILLTINSAARKSFRKPKRDIIGLPAGRVLGQRFFDRTFKPHIERCFQGEEVHTQEWLRLPEGGRAYYNITYFPLTSRDTIVGAVINAVEITKMKRMEEKLKLLTVTDRLTGIYNRKKFNDVLDAELTRARRYPSELALVMIDIDHFKNINDTYGHDVGDKVLVEMAKVIKDNIRNSDTFARWGGEEFMLLAPHTNLQEAATLAETIRRFVASYSFNTVGTVTLSFGVTQFLLRDSLEVFLKRADMALYKAKKRGRNRVVAASAPEFDFLGNLTPHLGDFF